MRKQTIWTVVVVVIIVLIGAGFGIAALHKTKTTPPATSSTTTNSSSGKPTTPSTSGSIIQTKTSSSVGQYLADANGNTLYTNGGDTTGVSNCTGTCLSAWPAYQPTSSTTTLPTNVTVIKRSDGTSQYAYKGMPLYTFASDSAGQVTGDGISNFHVAKP
jgi:predicted lipoprotein with Yx(FWY)xxD motif